MAKEADVIDFRQHKLNTKPVIRRLIPELDGLEMLYTNDTSDQVYSLKVLCWAIWSDGHIDGMVPWINQLAACRSLDDPLNGHWEGFMDPSTGKILFEAPQHKADYLSASSKYYPIDTASIQAIQEIPDTIGSHAVFTLDHFDNYHIQEIHSWRLYGDGSLMAMAVEADQVLNTPVLPGDECLYSVFHRKDFHYFFQNNIANKIKAKDPEALAAMAHLSGRRS